MLRPIDYDCDAEDDCYSDDDDNDEWNKENLRKYNIPSNITNNQMQLERNATHEPK